MSVRLIKASALRIPLENETVQCVVTSPPYWGLRKYAGAQELIWGGADGCEHEWAEDVQRTEIRTGLGLARFSEKFRGGGHKAADVGAFTVVRGTCVRCGAWRVAYGIEPTIEMYVAHTVEMLREIRRVLRADGVVFWNIGDSYSGSWGSYGGKNRGAGQQREIVRGSKAIQKSYLELAKWRPPSANPANGVKPKDLCLIPARVALAAQTDGWWVRSMIIWAKPNPMPESVTDRPTDAYEHIVMLTKSAKYFWDADAVREGVTGTAHSKGNKLSPPAKTTTGQHVQTDRKRAHAGWSSYTAELLTSRNMRNVWTFATQPYKGAHFATFPEELARRCILAATSERGACAQCGTPWRRIIKCSGGTIGQSWTRHEEDETKGMNGTASNFQERAHGRNGHPAYKRESVGWEATCMCETSARPCLVLDPFGGSGTTGQVARALGRDAVLLDIAYEPGAYLELAEARIATPPRWAKATTKRKPKTDRVTGALFGQEAAA